MGSTVTIDYTPEFLKSAKILAKRYISFKEDLKNFQNEIIKNPTAGVDLGNGLRKIRMAIKSKGKGKRGGARVITLTIGINKDTSKITFLYVYDKSDLDSISLNKIREIVSSNNL